MAESTITMLMSPLPGHRIVEGQDPEDGSILAFRKNGDEVLFASWFVDDEPGKPGKPTAWIPIGEFSVDPDAIMPPEIVQDAPSDPAQDAGDGTQERPVEEGPFGGSRRRGRSQRPEA